MGATNLGIRLRKVCPTWPIAAKSGQDIHSLSRDCEGSDKDNLPKPPGLALRRTLLYTEALSRNTGWYATVGVGYKDDLLALIKERQGHFQDGLHVCFPCHAPDFVAAGCGELGHIAFVAEAFDLKFQWLVGRLRFMPRPVDDEDRRF